MKVLFVAALLAGAALLSGCPTAAPAAESHAGHEHDEDDHAGHEHDEDDHPDDEQGEDDHAGHEHDEDDPDEETR